MRNIKAICPRVIFSSNSCYDLCTCWSTDHFYSVHAWSASNMIHKNIGFCNSVLKFGKTTNFARKNDSTLFWVHNQFSTLSPRIKRTYRVFVVECDSCSQRIGYEYILNAKIVRAGPTIVELKRFQIGVPITLLRALQYEFFFVKRISLDVLWAFYKGLMYIG